MLFIFILVSFGASTIGAICGVGGGVFIKPALDALNVLPVSTITFLSTCSVISMSAYNVINEAVSVRKNGSKSLIEWSYTTWLAVGAAAGGIIGKLLFGYIRDLSPDPEIVGVYQSVALLTAVFFTLLYTLNHSRFKEHHVKNQGLLICLGIVLGTISSFVGIGGGPMNIAVLFFFLSMPAKSAAQNSIYMILISQAASLITTFIQSSVPKGFFRAPDLELWLIFAGMIVGGISGGVIGKLINKKISETAVSKLFAGLLVVIMILCCYNIYIKL